MICDLKSCSVHTIRCICVIRKQGLKQSKSFKSRMWICFVSNDWIDYVLLGIHRICRNTKTNVSWNFFHLKSNKVSFLSGILFFTWFSNKHFYLFRYSWYFIQRKPSHVWFSFGDAWNIVSSSSIEQTVFFFCELFLFRLCCFMYIMFGVGQLLVSFTNIIFQLVSIFYLARSWSFKQNMVQKHISRFSYFLFARILANDFELWLQIKKQKQ